MKKISLIISVLLVFTSIVLAGCETEEVDNGDNLTTETTTLAEEYANLDNDEDESQTNEMSALEVYEGTEGSYSNLCLYRDGSLYSINSSLPINCYINQVMGIGADYSNGIRGMWGESRIDDDYIRIVSYGKVPVIEIGEDDVIRLYSEHEVKPLGINKAEFYGYGCYYNINNDGLSYVDLENGLFEFVSDVDSISIEKDGEEIEDPYNIDKGEEYTLSWYKGTEYGEAVLKADSSVYICNIPIFGHEHDYEVEPTYTKEGYVEYDVSDIPPGTYEIESCIVEIK